MQVHTVSWAEGRWSAPLRAELDSPQSVVLCFAAPSYLEQPAPLRELRATFPRAELIGCSTAGEIHGSKVSDESIAVVILRFDHARVRVARAALSAGGDSAAGSRAAGETLARALAAPDLKGVMILSDGLLVNGSALVQGVNGVLGHQVVVTGGLAGDGSAFRRTWVLDEHGDPRPGIVSALGIYGDRVHMGHGSKGGWDPFGPERVVTRSEGNVLYELDVKPALELYKTYLGERASGLPATALLFPLTLRRGASDRRVVRTILGVDEATQSLTFAGDIEQGAHAQLMRANFDRLVQGASDAALMTAGKGRDMPVVSIAISCVGRRLVLGERIEEETEATLDCLPKGSTQIGYYSYGEISPFVAGDACDLHNQTMTLTTLAEL